MKQNCRACPVREQCIQQSDTAPNVRLMMHRAFQSGTDTYDMWGLLQQNCLLERRDRSPTTRARPTSLGRRLRQRPPASPPPAPSSAAATPAPPPPPAVKKEEPRYGLILREGRHRIALPANGDLVLGRFDPTINVTPDVDLSNDDRDTHLISRRHARITGFGGVHEIEDLGSTNGTFVNGKRLSLGQRVRLHIGDRIALGYQEFVYMPLPQDSTTPPSKLRRAYLQTMTSGRHFDLPSWGQVIVGRSDPMVGFVPDIDLKDEGHAAQLVSRRHVKIIAREGLHYLEDMGSVSGTKLNGKRVSIGERVLLRPGDHIWLGGCVLAYDTLG